MATHIIHKQKVQLQTNMSADPFALQNRISNLLKNDLTRKIESLLDQVSPNGKILRIDKLEINLGTVNSQNLETEFTDKLMEQLSQALSERRTYSQSDGNEIQVQFTEIEQSRSLIDTLIYFFDHGYLPWNSSVKDIKQWEAELLATLSDKDWIKIGSIVKEANEESWLRRMSLQFSDQFLEKILFALLPSLQQNWNLLYDDFFFIINTLINKRDIRSGRRRNTNNSQKAVWLFALKAALFSKKEGDFIDAFVQNYFVSINSDKRNGKTFSDPEIMLLQQNIQSAIVIQALIQVKEGTKENVGGTTKPQKKKIEAEKELFVNNCGVIILHPFLQIFFAEMGLLDGKYFKDESAVQRGVLLLHYLATGETEVGEFNTMIEKLLCNIGFEEPVPNYIELSEKEKEESGNLLKAVTQHWEPLKRTSAEGLRTSFLQREGKLTMVENGWKLTVEQKTIDILLNKLPWSIGTIKLPWMKNFLSVEWV